MTPDLDIYHATNELIKQHSEDERIHAAMRGEEMLGPGDLDGQASVEAHFRGY